jgi:hypothetical protein
MSQPYPWAHKQFKSKTCKNAKTKHEVQQKQRIIETKENVKNQREAFWMKVSLGGTTTNHSKNEKGTKKQPNHFPKLFT